MCIRDRPSPYHVWVSEIMLQPTRVEAVKPYYQRFLSALPAVRDLAEVPEDQLLKLWEGLGYYNRVRNMQKAARQVMADYVGECPVTYEGIRSLAGIDVYKRQHFPMRPMCWEVDLWRERKKEKARWENILTQCCLLYTSRCV